MAKINEMLDVQGNKLNDGDIVECFHNKLSTWKNQDIRTEEGYKTTRVIATNKKNEQYACDYGLGTMSMWNNNFKGHEFSIKKIGTVNDNKFKGFKETLKMAQARE